MTVPLYFERQIAEDSNAYQKLPAFDSKIRIRKGSVIAAQIVLLAFGLSFSGYFAG